MDRLRRCARTDQRRTRLDGEDRESHALDEKLERAMLHAEEFTGPVAALAEPDEPCVANQRAKRFEVVERSGRIVGGKRRRVREQPRRGRGRDRRHALEARVQRLRW